MTLAPIHHICLDDRGIPFIAGASLKVADVVIDTYTWGQVPQEIQENYPKLSLSQIHAALAYYHDHQVLIDAQIADEKREFERLRAANPNPLTREQFESRLTDSLPG